MRQDPYFTLDADLVDRLKALGQACGTTLFMTLVAGFSALLSRYSQQETFVIGSPIANRRRKEIEPLIGFFVNTLVLRMELSGGRYCPSCCLGFETPVAPTGTGRPLNALSSVAARPTELSPFKVMFILQNQNERHQYPGFRLKLSYRREAAASMFDMTLKLEETGQGLAGEFEYNTDLFDVATIDRFIAHYRTLLTGFTTVQGQPVSQLPLLTEVERQQVLITWNETRQTYPREKTVHGLFEERARFHPERIALVVGTNHLTYDQLNDRASVLASYLSGLGVGPETLVGLFVTRSVEMMGGLLGILKAGAAYVDPAYPSAIGVDD